MLYDHTDASGRYLFSGTFEVCLTAYDPFGKMLRTAYTDAPLQGEAESTGILPAELMPRMPTKEDGSFLLYNPGTEKAQTLIRLTGNTGEGVRIRNLTTGQQCTIMNLKPTSLMEGAALELDSAMGQTRIVMGDKKELAFPFHDEGYLTLAPCTPFVREAAVAYTAASNVITSAGCFRPHMKGQYIYLGEWIKIIHVQDAEHALIAKQMQADGNAKTPIVTMNEIDMDASTAALTSFEMSYTPCV